MRFRRESTPLTHGVTVLDYRCRHVLLKVEYSRSKA